MSIALCKLVPEGKTEGLDNALSGGLWGIVSALGMGAVVSTPSVRVSDDRGPSTGLSKGLVTT